MYYTQCSVSVSFVTRIMFLWSPITAGDHQRCHRPIECHRLVSGSIAHFHHGIHIKPNCWCPARLCIDSSYDGFFRSEIVMVESDGCS
eukprot:UN1867